jgi:hypothetical protein
MRIDGRKAAVLNMPEMEQKVISTAAVSCSGRRSLELRFTAHRARDREHPAGSGSNLVGRVGRIGNADARNRHGDEQRAR